MFAQSCFIVLIILINFSTTTGIPSHNSSAFNFNINVQGGNSPQSIGAMPDATQPFLDITAQHASNIVKSLPTTIKNFSMPLSIITIGTIYLFILIDLRKGRQLLRDKNSWCCWKQHCTIDYLSQQPRNELCDPLLLDIQERYMNLDDPTNSTAPLAAFLPALQKEIDQLERYCYWGKQLLKWHCSYFFAVNKKSYESAREAIVRLRFIKKVFIQWWANHNTQQHIQKELIAKRNRDSHISKES